MKGDAEMDNYSEIKVIKDGYIYVVQWRFDGIWRCCGRYLDKAKAVLAANYLAYCYGCNVVSITKK